MESLLDNPQYKERWAMYESALAVGLPIVSRDVCAIICAMLLVWGNHEMFTHHHRLVCELRYAQKRFHIEGSESPDAEFAVLLQSYVSQLELMQQRENRVQRSRNRQKGVKDDDDDDDFDDDRYPLDLNDESF